MQRLPYLLRLSCILLFSAPSAIAHAQSPAPVGPVGRPLPAAASPGHTVTIDMQRILAECKSFQEQLAAMRATNDERHAAVEKLRDEVIDVANQRKQFVPASLNHIETSHRLFALQGDLAAAEKTAQYESNRAEVALYAQFHRRVETEIEMFAQRNKISLVLNRPTPAQRVTDMADVKELFAQRIAYEHELDITDEILKRLVPTNGCRSSSGIFTLMTFGLAAVAAKVDAEELSPRFGDQPAAHAAVVSWHELLGEHQRYRTAEEERFQEEVRELARLNSLKQELVQWQSFRSKLQGGAEDECAARALREIIAGKQREIDTQESLAKLDFQRRARENLDDAIDEIVAEIERFSQKHGISIVVSKEFEVPEFRFADLSVFVCRRPRPRTIPEPDHETPVEARARFDEEVVFQHNIDITYDIITAINRSR